jgi:opacity protein-like surface antigen
MKKKTYVLGMALLLAGALAFAGAAQAAMWVGAELGANFIPSPSAKISPNGINSFNVNNILIAPAVIGGMTIGYDFVNSGFGAYGWPDWMKYFSIATDLTYNRLSVHNQTVTVAGNRVHLFPNADEADGYCVTWSFLLMAHYGFFPDSEVPTGRVVPYIGVGPGIMFSGINLGAWSAGQAGSTNIALVVEPGIRWMCMKNISIDTGFRWRYAAPQYSFSGVNGGKVELNSLSQLSVLVRANYHF